MIADDLTNDVWMLIEFIPDFLSLIAHVPHEQDDLLEPCSVWLLAHSSLLPIQVGQPGTSSSPVFQPPGQLAMTFGGFYNIWLYV